MHADTHTQTHTFSSQPFELAAIVRNTPSRLTHAECFSNSTIEPSFVKSFQIVAPHARLSLPGLYLADLIVIELEI